MSGNLWVITDGKAGDEAQCIGVAEALGLPYEVRRVAPRKLFALAMPHGPIDPADSPNKPKSPIARPFPKVAIASGRRSIPYLRAIKKFSGGKTITVCLKDPRTGCKAADIIWVATHDKLRGPNVIVSPTAPHRFSKERLAEARANPWPEIASLPKPRLAVLVGGNSKHHHFTEEDIARLGDGLSEASKTHSLMITVSRRTPDALADRLRQFGARPNHLYWEGDGPNPLLQYLANAQGVVVTTDSTNMVGEAAATGYPIYGFQPEGGHKKFDLFLGTLRGMNVLHPFPGLLEGTTYEPMDSTPVIADAIRERLQRG
ncbi:mitochondrial fission ELM1 family protein [Pseudovibrio sp. SPO723]|uniref:mitochondrial fission ELM1 family protein n=1 Tax=Nesiotobacter zosterae TaxID=392721 RepID=UPI0029C57C20|nr:mitochondrial fission ELM1 family protein [Pseudovibrio sp. SPO723]MDX5593958.1 mitochondrial fission ELM1 family protein [Pseudovibrio sp. SPO723]